MSFEIGDIVEFKKEKHRLHFKAEIINKIYGFYEIKIIECNNKSLEGKRKVFKEGGELSEFIKLVE